MTKSRQGGDVRHSDFVIPSTFDIRHSSLSSPRHTEGNLRAHLQVWRSSCDAGFLKDQIPGQCLARNFLKHLRVGREFFDEHEQTLNRFFRFMASEAAADQINFLQFPRLQE
jgi:hypothetical protein